MSATSGGASWKSTPSNRFHTARSAGANASSTYASKNNEAENSLHLTLKNIIGNTTRSVSAFDASPERNSFVCCAGPAVVLSQIDEHHNISQRLFRAKPNTAPLNVTQSFYNPSIPPKTPARSLYGSPLKARGPGVGPTASSERDFPDHFSGSSRSRETTCVSFSHKGHLLAVGEVNKLPYPHFLFLVDMLRQGPIPEFWYTLQHLMRRLTFLYQSWLTIVSASPLLPFQKTLAGCVPLGTAMMVSY